MDGWVKLYRKFTEWEWYSDINTSRLFLHLLLKASTKNKNWKGETILPGQIVVGRKKLSEETGLSEQEIRTSIGKLKSTNEITLKTTNKYSIITISKWESYQYKNEDDQPTDQPTNSQSSNQQSTTSKEYKNIRRKEYKKILLSKIEISDFPELNPEYFEIAKSFHLLFKKNLEEAGAATTTLEKANGTWIDDIRLMIEADKCTMDNLRDAFRLLQKDAFWKSNILSTSTLRKQMSKLILKSRNGENRSNSKEGTSTGELAAIIHDAFHTGH